MFKALRHYFPSRLFVLSNILFWLVLNTIAADHTHRTRVMYGRDSDWYITWFEYIPWWGNWAIVAPFIVAAVRTINLDENRTLVFTLKNLLVMAVAMVAYGGLTILELALIHGRGELQWEAVTGSFEHLLMSPMHMDLLVYMAVASLGFTMNYYASNKQQAVNNQKLANQLLKVELQSLKSQLSPHFLFNTLNTISGLVRLEQKDDAVQALSELSKMFRKVLENQKTQMTNLSNEMEFIDSYLAIQKMRFENKLAVETHVQTDCLDLKIPFMLLHTLVENAVQHGSQLESDRNLLRLKVEKVQGRLAISLTNKVCQKSDHKGFGIGLNNCRQRLKHIYRSDYRLDCEETQDGYFQTVLSLPIGEFDA